MMDVGLDMPDFLTTQKKKKNDMTDLTQCNGTWNFSKLVRLLYLFLPFLLADLEV